MLRRVAAATVAAVVVCVSAGVGSALADDWTRAVQSRPGFRIPRVAVTANDPGVAPGFIFVTPRTIYPGRTGPTILDKDGHVVWFHRQSHRLAAQDLRPQMYLGNPVLTWSVAPPFLREGQVLTRNATKHNTYNIIADQSYRIIKRVRAVGRGVITNGHEFVLTGRNTALVLGSRALPRRLARYHGPRRGSIVDDLVQEIDLRTNKVIFSWSSARHIRLSESMVRPPKTGRWDPFHLNAISEDLDGNLLVSARHTSTVYKISRRSGQIIWKLGGRDSTFSGSGTHFYYQHSAMRLPDGTITLFDNHTTADDASHGKYSMAKRIRLDLKRNTATLVQTFRHPSGGPGVATSQGNAEVLPNGNMFVGWGISPWFAEYAADGRLLFSAHFPSVWHHSYRAFKAPWVGKPTGGPAVTARVGPGRVAAYVSWNGATEVANWQLLGGPDPDNLAPIGTAPWANFETKLRFPGNPAWVRVDALDASGGVIGQSAVIEPKR